MGGLYPAIAGFLIMLEIKSRKILSKPGKLQMLLRFGNLS